MSRKTSRITISLPAELLDAAEAKLAREGEGASALVRRLFEDALREAEERERVDQYLRGYQEIPQSDEEFGWADSAGKEMLGDREWK